MKRKLAHELNGVKDFPASPEHVSTTALSISTLYPVVKVISEKWIYSALKLPFWYELNAPASSGIVCRLAYGGYLWI